MSVENNSIEQSNMKSLTLNGCNWLRFLFMVFSAFRKLFFNFALDARMANTGKLFKKVWKICSDGSSTKVKFHMWIRVCFYRHYTCGKCSRWASSSKQNHIGCRRWEIARWYYRVQTCTRQDVAGCVDCHASDTYEIICYFRYRCKGASYKLYGAHCFACSEHFLCKFLKKFHIFMINFIDTY